MNDDFSYTRSVQLLLETKHVHYVGWAAAMLGWQLYLGALFAKVFGFSFTVVRASLLPVAMATAWLMQRSFVRAGLNERNATLGTMTVTLSPLFLALTFSFMTDIPGMFCIVLCFYSCLRALQAGTDRASAGWIAFAALGNALDGTVRQNAWLGVLVMVPCACWLLRRHPLTVKAAMLSWSVSAVWIVWCLRWFSLQPYVLAYGAVVRSTHKVGPLLLAVTLFRTALDIALFALPVLIAFAWAVPRRTRWRTFATVCTVVLALVLVSAQTRRWIHLMLAPYLVDAVTIYGPVANVEHLGKRPVVLSLGVRVALSIALFTALACLWSWVRSRTQTGDQTEAPNGFRVRPATPQEPARRNSMQTAPKSVIVPSARDLCLLVGPLLAVYFALLLPRGVIFDRYLLVPLLFAVLAALLFFQQTVRSRLPAWSVAMVCLFMVYGIAVTHDLFAMYRAFVTALTEAQASGVPRDAIDGGLEYNGWTQVTESPSLNSPEIQNPAHAYVPHPELEPKSGSQPESGSSCTLQFPTLVPLVRPRFALSFDAAACGGPAGFAPVVYRPWLGMHAVSVYVVRVGRGKR